MRLTSRKSVKPAGPNHRFLVTVLAGAFLLGGAGWVGASGMETPEERLAARAPSPGPVVVPVEERVLVDGLVSRADVEFEGVQEVALPAALDGLVISDVLVQPDTNLTSGTAILQIQGRPVLVLEGALPAWRDLQIGSTGPDVAQLQRALEALGHYGGPVDGAFGMSTSAAVARLYTATGHTPPPVPDELAAAIADAARQVADAANGIAQLSEARQASAADEARATDATRRESAAALERANAEMRAVADATAKRVAAAQAEVDTARLAVEQAVDDEQRAERQARLEEADLLLLDAVSAADAEIHVARAEVARLEAELVQAIPGPPSAEEALARVREDRELQSGLSDAELAREELLGKAAPALPMNEVLFIPVLPRRIQRISAAPGGRVQESGLTLAGERVLARSVVPVGSGGDIAVGQEALIEGRSGEQFQGAVLSSSPSEDGTTVTLLVTLDEAAAPLVGTNVMMRVPEASTDGAVLAVPLSALHTGATGDVQVLRQDGDRTIERIDVTLGVEADGFAQVRSSDPTKALRPGDWVVVGALEQADADQS